MEPTKSSTRTLKTKKQERRRYSDGTTAVLDFTLDGKPTTEEYVAPDRALIYRVDWAEAFRNESYYEHNEMLSLGEYEVARLQFPAMPASQGFEGVDDLTIAGVTRDYKGNRVTVFKLAPGHILHRAHDADGNWVDGRNYQKLSNGGTILEHLGRDGVLHQRIVESMAADRTGFYYQHWYAGNQFREQFGKDAQGAPPDFENYQVDRRPATREEYEAARHICSDMPPADFAARDVQAEVRAREALKVPTPVKSPSSTIRSGTLSSGDSIDAGCLELLEEGRIEAREWMKKKHNTLGEMNRRSSTTLLNQLYELGCVNIFIIDIEEGDEDEGDNGSGLVVELPDDYGQRMAILQRSHRIVSKQGFSGDKDVGQSFNYIKLD